MNKQAVDLPTIVISNDDGIDAPGIRNLWKALHKIAHVVIVAPAEDQSCKGVGISIPKSRYIEAEKIHWSDDENTEAWKVHGTPADCTKFALHYLLKDKPHFFLSGINNGSNAGRNLIYSGTVGAVIQATLENIPGAAFSCMYEEDEEKFAKVRPYIAKLLKHFKSHPIPKGTLMNINFPIHKVKDIKGFRMAKQGKSYWDVRIGSDSSLRGTKKYPILDAWDYRYEDQDSDIRLLTEGFITCVPIHIEDWTDINHWKNRREKFNELNHLE